MSLTDKQVNYLGGLWREIKTYSESAPDVDTSALEPLFDLVVQVEVGDPGFTRSQFNEMIDAFKDILATRPVARWKKIGDTWALNGPESIMVEGNTITVVSRKGEQQVVVGKILNAFEGEVIAEVAKDEPESTDGTFTATKEGFYWRGEEIIEAAFTKNGYLVAHLLEDNKRVEYLGQKGLRGLDRQLTFEEVQEKGRETGTCMSCGRHLTDPESILNGIGPICSTKGGWA